MDQLSNGEYRLRTSEYDFIFDVAAAKATASSAESHDFFALSCRFHPGRKIFFK